MNKKEETIKTKILIALFSLSIILCIVFIVRTIAKYVMKEEDTHVQESTEFYFESEIADVNSGKDYLINDWDGVTTKSIEFDVRNYVSSLLKTNEEIKYKINATIIDEDQDEIKDEELIGVQIVDTGSASIIEEEEILILSNSGLSKNNYKLDISKLGDIENGKTFNIKLVISSISPYTKELVSNISIKVNRIENYEVTLQEASNGEYVTLNIKVNNPEEDIEIKYDNTKMILDQSTSIVNDVSVTSEDTINSFIIAKEKFEKGKNYEIYFIKQQDEIVLGTDIIVD